MADGSFVTRHVSKPSKVLTSAWEIGHKTSSGRSTEDLGLLLGTSWGRSSVSFSSFSHFLFRIPTSLASISNFLVEDLCSFCTSVNIRKMEFSIDECWAGKLSSGPTITTLSVWVETLLWLFRCCWTCRFTRSCSSSVNSSKKDGARFGELASAL